MPGTTGRGGSAQIDQIDSAQIDSAQIDSAQIDSAQIDTAPHSGDATRRGRGACRTRP